MTERPEDYNLRIAIESVADATRRLEWARKHLVVATKQAECKHEHIDNRGVFGSKCMDCEFDFNDGGW